MALSTMAPESNCQFDKLSVDGIPADDESGYRYWQLEAPRPGAPGVQEQYALPFGHGRLVGMAADNRMESRRYRVEVKGLDIVQHVERDAPHLDHFGFGQGVGPLPLVIVPAYGDHRGDSVQCFEYLRCPDVPCMDDHLDALKGFDGFRAHQAMSI